MFKENCKIHPFKSIFSSLEMYLNLVMSYNFIEHLCRAYLQNRQKVFNDALVHLILRAWNQNILHNCMKANSNWFILQDSIVILA